MSALTRSRFREEDSRRVFRLEAHTFVVPNENPALSARLQLSQPADLTTRRHQWGAAMLARMWFVYIVRCADRSLYTGIATDAHRRVDQHNCGRGARYTRARCPVRLVYLESAHDRGAALRREHEIKRMSPGEKRRLVWISRKRHVRTR
jgi:putative endonuclease